MATPQFNLFDFTGGIHESGFPLDYTDRQWQELKGFVLEPNGALRSQWECQKVSTTTGWGAVRAFRSGTTNYLVAITTGGTIWYMPAPADDMVNASVAALTGWVQVATANPVEGGTAVAVTPFPSYRFMCEMPVIGNVTKAPRNGLIINTASIDAGNGAIVLSESVTTAGTLTATIYTGAAHRYPGSFKANENGDITGDSNLDIFVYGTTQVIPHGTVGCMWGDFLCVAGSRWFPSYDDAMSFDTAPLSDANSSPKLNGFWVSNVNALGAPDTTCFVPAEDMYGGNLSAEALITDMRVVDQGLVLFTTQVGSGRSGVVLIKGTARASRPYVLRDAIGTADQTIDQGYEKVTGFWPEAGVTAFVEKSGSIWYTDGNVVDRLDRVGPGTIHGSTYGDCVEGMRGYLLVARGKRLLCLNIVGREDILGSTNSNGIAAWTELVTPNSAYANKSLTSIGMSTYFLNNGVMYRYTMQGVNRGSVAGATPNLTVTTAPVGDLSGLVKPRWIRAGVEAHEPSDSTATTDATIVSVSTLNGSSFTDDTPNILTTPVMRSVSGDTQSIVRAHGQSRIAAVKVIATGDLIIDGVRIWALGKAEDKTWGGK